jgi:putative endonuclease
MRQKSEVGKIGEEIAAEYLKDKKYRILYTNKRWPWGELDIVSRDRDGVLVFVEVKTLFGTGELRPEQNYTFDKDRKTKRTAELFANKYKELVDENLGYRIDLVTVHIKDPLLTNWRKDCDVKHYENV